MEIKLAFLALIAFALIASSAHADANISNNVSATYCLDADTLRVQQFASLNGTASSRIEDQLCQYGCDSVLSACEPAPIWIIAGFVIVLIVMAVVARRYNKI